MISAKLRRHVSSAVSHNIRIANGSGNWNKKCYTVVACCEQHDNPSIVLTERERKDCFEHRARNHTAVFQSGTREGIKLAWKIWQSHQTAYLAGIRFVRCGFSAVKSHHCGPKRVLFVLIELKEKLVTIVFHLFVFGCKRKNWITLYGHQIFAYDDWKKNFSHQLTPP